MAPCLTSVPHNPDDPAHKCCLSVVGEKRALDVEFDTPVQRDEWLLLLEWWIEQTKAEAEDSRLGVPAPLSGGSSPSPMALQNLGRAHWRCAQTCNELDSTVHTQYHGLGTKVNTSKLHYLT